MKLKSGWNGLLVDIDDADALARGIEWVLSQTNDPGERYLQTPMTP